MEFMFSFCKIGFGKLYRFVNHQNIVKEPLAAASAVKVYPLLFIVVLKHGQGEPRTYGSKFLKAIVLLGAGASHLCFFHLCLCNRYFLLLFPSLLFLTRTFSVGLFVIYCRFFQGRCWIFWMLLFLSLLEYRIS